MDVIRNSLAGLAVALLGFGIAAPAAAQTDVRFSLDWNFEGPAAPFLIALDKGYFADEGLNVSIDTAPGSLEPINRVASGTYDMGFGDINSLIKFRDANPSADLRAVYMVYNKPAFSIVGRKSLGVSEPKDLEGRTLGAPAPDGAYAQWPIFVQANDIDASAVTIENIGFPVREPMLASGDVDAITGFSFSAFINLKRAGVDEDDITVMLMADHGVELYGNAIFVSQSFAEANPEAVRGFLAAFTKGMHDTIADPAAGAAVVVQHNQIADVGSETERLEIALRENMVTDEVRDIGLGAISEDRLARAIEQIALTYDFQQDPPGPGDVFDDSYLPPQEERQVD
jgi:NitT/TauT family transport system substrate-binding protein